MVGSIVVGLVGIYYKREELKVKAKELFTKKTPAPEPAPEPTRVEPEPAPAPQKTGLIKMR